jgi:uncharacterized membrane protein YedE/YeeE
VNRLSILFVVVIATLALGVYAGFSSYRASPEGVLLYSTVEPCLVMQHSFTLVYVLFMAVASIASGLVAIVLFTASAMQRFSTRKHRLRSIAKLCLVAIGVFVASSFLSGLFEAHLPLHVKPGCERHAA